MAAYVRAPIDGLMNNIRNTMCRLSDLTNEQVDSLVDAMPDSDCFDFDIGEPCIGVTKNGSWGTWLGKDSPSIKTYAGMMQLLGKKDMNKKTAQEQMKAMQIEMDKLKAIINTPEVKTGRVLSAGDLELNAEYWFVYTGVSRTSMDNNDFDKARIKNGKAFHDKETARKYFEYLKLEQELRIAQAADGGEGTHAILLTKGDALQTEPSSNYIEKISFKTEEARDRFFAVHTREQLILLIRGV
jgi:hypothetical protein